MKFGGRSAAPRRVKERAWDRVLFPLGIYSTNSNLLVDLVVRLSLFNSFL